MAQEKITSGALTVLVNHLGAEVASVQDKDVREFMWQAKKDVWPRHAPVLFPIVGKLRDNRYTYQGKEYSLSQHGFARDMKFSVVSRGASACVFELRASEDTRKIYPFDFVLQISYELQANELVTRYTVKNPSGEPILFGIGAHPGFRCPLEAGEKFSDYYIEFDHDTFLQTALQDGLRSETSKVLPLVGKKLFLSETLFDQDALVFENHQVERISLCSPSGKRIEMRCEGWPYFGIWSKKGCTEFVCLEPWYGIADRVGSDGVLERKEGMIRLEPGKEFSCSFTTAFY